MCTIFLFCLLKGVFKIQIMSAPLKLNRRKNTTSSLTIFTVQVPLPHCCAYCLVFPLVLEVICISPTQFIFLCGYKPQAAPNSFNATSDPEGGSSFSSLFKQTNKQRQLTIPAIKKPDIELMAAVRETTQKYSTHAQNWVYISHLN